MSEFKEQNDDSVLVVSSEKSPNENTSSKNENLSDESIKFGNVMSPSDVFGLKKKKKKKPFILGDLITDLEEPELKNIIEEAPIKEIDEVVIDMDNDFDFSVAKKKKKKVIFVESTPLEAEPVVKAEDVTDALSGLIHPESWTGVDRDYTYEELLMYLFHSIMEKNPDIVIGEKKRIILKPPQVLRVGTKKTSFANFYETCKSVHRQPKHLQAYLLSELGTNGSIDANCQLIIKGRFQQKQIENVLRRYIKEYVTCHTCHSPDTILQKDTRLFFLQCETCGSRCSVSSIKSGFQAVTSKRAAMRAKTG